MKPIMAVLLLAAVGSIVADAATINWTNTAGGNWSVAANWNPNQVPGASDIAVINSSGTYTVTLDTSPTVGSLTLGGAGKQTLTTAGYNLALNNASLVKANGILAFNGGNLSGPGLLTVIGQFNWTNGTIDASSTLTVATNGMLVLAGNNGSSYVMQGTLTNAGIVQLVSGNLQLNYCNGGPLINLSGGLLDLKSDVSIVSGCGGGPSLINMGTVRKSGGTGTSTIYPTFNNNGTLDVQTGTVSLAASYNLIN